MPDNLTDVGTYQVTYGTVDQNRHMNNTTYPDMYSSFLPLNSKRFKSITINYANEAPMGEVLRVQKGDYDGIYYFRTIRSDGKINSEAEIELTDIK
jgi:acyl-ACP thioesterase